MEKFCFFCATSHMGTIVPDNRNKNLEESDGTPEEPEPSHKLLFKYLLSNTDQDETLSPNSLLQDITNELNSSAKNGGVLQVCSFCNKNAEELRELRTELEKLQRKIITILDSFRGRAAIASLIIGVDQPSNSNSPPKHGALGAVGEDAMKLFKLFHSHVKLAQFGNFKALLPDPVHRVPALINEIKRREALSKQPPIKEEVESDFDPDSQSDSDSESDSDSSSDSSSESDSDDEDDVEVKQEVESDESNDIDFPVASTSAKANENHLKRKCEEAPSCIQTNIAGESETDPQPGPSRSAKGMNLPKKSKVANGNSSGPHNGSGSRLIEKPANKVKLLNMKKIMRASLLKCKHCNYTGSQLSVIENHLQTQHENEMKNYICPSCDITFTTEQLYWVHMRYHEQLIKCDICNSSVLIVDMKQHLSTHKERVFPCPGCSYIFGNFMKLLHHVNSSKHPNIALKCGFCSESNDPFPSKQRNLLYHHLAYEHNRKELVHECEVPDCSKIFFDKKAHKLHVKTVHTNVFACTKCSSTFGTEFRLANHVKRIHDKVADIQCMICPRYFVYNHQLEHHHVTAHGMPKHKCNVLTCTREFTSTAALKSHKKKHGMAPKMMKKMTCLKCLKICENKTQLKVHMATHSEFKGYACVSCGFETANRNLLKRHKRTHSDKAFCCTFCPKRFNIKKYLEEHLRIHTKERPFRCDICFASFAQKGTLNTHMKIHEKDKSASKEPLPSTSK